jgi:hypothetical protein
MMVKTLLMYIECWKCELSRINFARENTDSPINNIKNKKKGNLETLENDFLVTSRLIYGSTVIPHFLNSAICMLPRKG